MYCSKYSLMVGTLCMVAVLCFSSMSIAGMLLNVDIDGRSQTTQTPVTTSGAAAVGAAGDIWNGYYVNAGNPAGGTFLSVDPPQSDFLVDSAGNTTTVKFDIAAVCGHTDPLAGDDMASDTAFVQGLNVTATAFPTSTTMTLSGLGAGDTYDLYLYAPAKYAAYATSFTVGGQTASTPIGPVFTGVWNQGIDYVKFSGVTVAPDGTIQCGLTSGNPDNYGPVSGLQLMEVEPVVLGGTPVNIDINGRSNLSQSNVTKSGAAAIGEVGDVWNGYTVEAVTPAGVFLPSVDPAPSGSLVDADGNATTIQFDVTAVCADAPTYSTDDMANDNIFVEGLNAGTGFPTSATFTISGLDVGEAYDLYLYSPANYADYAGKFTIDGVTASTPVGPLFDGTWTEDIDYVVFSNVVAEGGIIECLFESNNPSNYGMLSGIQIVPSVPEPSLLLMLATIACSTLFVRRR